MSQNWNVYTLPSLEEHALRPPLSCMLMHVYSGASLNGPSQKRTTSLEWTHTKAPIDFSYTTDTIRADLSLLTPSVNSIGNKHVLGWYNEKRQTSEIGTTSLQGTLGISPKRPFLGGSTVGMCFVGVFNMLLCCRYSVYTYWRNSREDGGTKNFLSVRLI